MAGQLIAVAAYLAEYVELGMETLAALGPAGPDRRRRRLRLLAAGPVSAR